MSAEARDPEIEPTGAFWPPGIRIRNRVIGEHRPGVHGHEREHEPGPDAVLQPRSDRSVPDVSLAERLRARLREEG